MKRITLVILLLAMAYTAVAQDISGTVKDADGKPLPGASVYWADTTVGTSSDLDGKFRLHRVKGYESLVTSFLGYSNDTLHIADQSAVEIRLTQGVELESVTIDSSIGGNYIKQDGLLKTENISFAGLCKMACCSVAESFENSASVTVGYSDAISGARQIKMLGLAGTYTQILDTNRPIMRGLAAPYGLTYTPGMWLNSIQVSKGISSVTAGHEAITGQINLEQRKPTDQERLFINAYFDSELRPELNITTALPVTDDSRLSTIILAHASADTKSHDRNGDGYRDMPESRQLSLANHWLYQVPNGMQIRWGVKGTYDYRLGGQMSYRPSLHADPDGMQQSNIYGSEVENKEVNAYFKLGCPVGRAVYDVDERDEKRSNVAMVIDYDYFDEDSYFGALRNYRGRQHMGNANLMYVHYFSARSSLNSGISGSVRGVRETLDIREQGSKPAEQYFNRTESEAGVYSEYTYTVKDRLSVVAGLRYDYNFFFRKHMVTPRAHAKWNMTSSTVVRGSVGLGYRPTDIITDNIGIMATGRDLVFLTSDISDMDRMEKALTAGGSISQSISTFGHHDLTISFDYFRTQLFHSIVVDQERTADSICIYESDKASYTNSYQVDVTWNPVKNLDIFATFRYTDSTYTIDREDGTSVQVERPLSPEFKTLLNVQYATNMRKWIFDFTAQVNGRSRIPTQTGRLEDSEYSPVYPMFYLQVTRKIRHWDIYLGCENIGDYRQTNPILNYQTPYSTSFNSSCIWGPLMGRKFYIGVRFNMY